MDDLSTNDFAAYFEAVHGHCPFPWQQRLLELVVEQGWWPSLLDLPTGSGKTAALDVAVFAQALEAHLQPSEHRCPRRTILVVDRRTVVDQAFRRARKIEESLRNPSNAVVRAVADRLASLAGAGGGGRTPVQVHELRGGIPRDESWARTPSQPILAVSTVDQVGSRLLFRGYGVSRGMRPLQAGLLGNDVLFLLDEVHLATAFRDTLSALQGRYRKFEKDSLPNRWQVVQMSATPGSMPDHAFSLDPDDSNHSVLSKRLQARKPTALVRITKPGRDALATEMAKRAAACALKRATVAVVVNRVATAARVHELLVSALSGDGIEPRLVTGRMRPFDRADLEDQLVEEVGSDRDRSEPRTLVVVATQCIEAGADFDFDVLLTECASLDSLRQRFGRLNRLGLNDCGEGVVFIRETDLKTKDGTTDPVYGDALRETWNFLESLDGLDFGIAALPSPPPEQLECLIAPLHPAPILLPTHLDAWVQTSPEPHADPDPALWLHGQRLADLDVSVVWRADIDEVSLRTDRSDTAARDELLERLKERLEACPPRSMESLQIPIGVVRRWLTRQATGDTSDAGVLPGEENDLDPHLARPAIVWSGESTRLLDLRFRELSSLVPGETLVVPSEYGGLRRGNWDPDAKASVADYGDRAQLEQRGRVTLRLHHRVLAMALEDEQVSPPARRADDVDAEAEAFEIRDFLHGLDCSGWLSDIVSALANEYENAVFDDSSMRLPKAPRVIPVSALDAERDVVSQVLVLQGRERYKQLDDGTLDLNAESEQSSLTGVEVGLNDHLFGVGRFARDFAVSLGLPDELVRALELAGQWHDTGKADPRFQQWLHSGSAFRALTATRLLAKSAMPSQSRAARERARKRSGYPKGARHELLSLALLQSLPAPLAADVDWPLVLYLVASHHGFCRPFAPYVPDEQPVDVTVEISGHTVSGNSHHGLERLDSGVVDRFWYLVRRYGWYGLAWLESIFRLADHRRSEAEVNGTAVHNEEREHDT